MREQVGPFMKWFGSKWRLAKKYPPPKHLTIVEPFAGSAGYSCLYHNRQIFLADTHKNVVDLWNLFIYHSEQIEPIPVDLPPYSKFESLALSREQELVLNAWQRTNTVTMTRHTSSWGSKPGQWIESTKNRLMNQCRMIGHWSVRHATWHETFDRFRDLPVTWFIDPPYQYGYDYRQPRIDYKLLGEQIRTLKGQVIVCEGIGKNGEKPDWLPFVELASNVVTMRRDLGRTCTELFYHQERE